MWCLAYLQVLQYNPSEDAWSQIGSLKRERVGHAISEVNLFAVGCVGNLNLLKITNTVITTINYHHSHKNLYILKTRAINRSRKAVNRSPGHSWNRARWGWKVDRRAVWRAEKVHCWTVCRTEEVHCSKVSNMLWLSIKSNQIQNHQ